MLVSKCDICKKKAEESLYVGINTAFPSKEFCYTCAKPMVDFLKKYNFIKNNIKIKNKNEKHKEKK